MVSWKSIPGFSAYEASTDGQVRRVVLPFSGPNRHKPLPHLIKSNHNWDGYLQIDLYDDDGVRRCRRVNRLVAITHIGPPPSDKHQCAHKNGVRSDNRVENLEWTTVDENIFHRNLHGTNGRRLSEDDVAGILWLLASGEPQLKIAKSYGVSQSMISRIKNRKSWSYQIERLGKGSSSRTTPVSKECREWGLDDNGSISV